MNFILNFKQEQMNDYVRLEIEKNTLLIEFFPASDTPTDLLATAYKRDRFNFCISYLLAPYIERELDYEENFQLETIKHEGFAIFLKFKRNVDFKIVNAMFSMAHFPPRYFGYFLSEANREEIYTSFDTFSEQDESAITMLKECDQNNESIDETIKMTLALWQRNKTSIQNYLNHYKQVISESLATKESFEITQNKLSNLNDEFEQIKKAYEQENKASKEQLTKDLSQEEKEIQTLIDSIDEDKISNQIASMEQTVKNLLNDKSGKKIHQELLEQQLIEGESIEASKFEEKDIALTSEWMEEFNLKSDPSICQNLSYELLEKNIFEAEAVLIYATLPNQLYIRERMKELNVEQQKIYDDFIQVTNAFVLFDSKFSKSTISSIDSEQKVNTTWWNKLF